MLSIGMWGLFCFILGGFGGWGLFFHFLEALPDQALAKLWSNDMVLTVVLLKWSTLSQAEIQLVNTFSE